MTRAAWLALLILPGCAALDDTQLRADYLGGTIDLRRRQQSLDAEIIQALARAAHQPAYTQTTHPDGSVTVSVGQQIAPALVAYVLAGQRGERLAPLPEPTASTAWRVGATVLGPVLGILADGLADKWAFNAFGTALTSTVNLLGRPTQTTITSGNRWDSADYANSFNPVDWRNSGRIDSPDDSTAPPTAPVIVRPEVVQPQVVIP